MRRVILLCTLLGICFVGWQVFSRRTATIDLRPGYALSYTVAWGLGMDQQLTLNRGWMPWDTVSSPWIEIWKKPHNSGAVVYSSEDGETYSIGTSYNIVVVALSKGTILARCNEAAIPKRAALAEQLLFQGAQHYEQIDPGAVRFPAYVRPEASAGGVPATPPLSRYYQGLRYLGQFGIVDPGPRNGLSRGTEVRFIPAGNYPEPRLGLEHHCS